jgi:hypothetical protein
MQNTTTFHLMKQASCDFLTEEFPEGCTSFEKQVAWIDDHKWEPFENKDSAEVLQYIEDSAGNWQHFLQTLGTTISGE